MRYIGFFIMWVVIIYLSTHTAFAQQGDKQKIETLLISQSRAWNNGDLETFMQVYWRSDSLLFIGKNGVTYGWLAILDRYKKNYPDTASMGRLNFKLLEFKRLAPTIYFVIGKWHLQRSIGNLEGHFSLVFQKIKGEWKIIADHSS